MDKALLVDISYTEEPYAVRIDPAQLAKQPDGTYHIEGGSPGAHASSHAAGGSDPVTLSMSQVSGLSAAIAPLGTATSAAAPSTLALRDAAGAAEFAGLSIDTTPTVVQTGAPGKLIWNETDGTLEFQLKGGNVTLQLGQEQVLRVRNAEATTLVDGEVVYLSGSTGVHNTAWRASNLTEAASARTIGVVTEHIAAGADGYVTTFGMVRGLDTNHLTEGALVYLGTAGATTVTAAVPPAHNVVVGYCVKKSEGNGAIFVHVQSGFGLHELHDVLLGAQAEGDTLAWDNVTKVWRNVTTSAAAWLLKAGDAMLGPLQLAASALGAAGTAALKIPSGPLLITPEAGAIERLVDKLYLTISTGLRKPVVLADSALTAGRVLFTTTDGRVLDSAHFTRDPVTGDITLGDGAKLILGGANALGEGNIIMAAPASAAFDTNLVISDSSAKTMGYVCGPTAAFVGSSGPFFGMRGNTYSSYANQRGNLFFYGGRPTTPGANEGRVIFGTNDTERMYITYAGLVVMANATILDLPTGRVIVTTTGGRCASDAGLTWASSTLGTTKLQVGGGTAFTKIVVHTPSLTPASVAAGAPSEQTFAVSGLTTDDIVSVNAPGAAVFSARVSAADTLAVTFMPPASGSYTPPSGTYRIIAHRS